MALPCKTPLSIIIVGHFGNNPEALQLPTHKGFRLVTREKFDCGGSGPQEMTHGRVTRRPVSPATQDSIERAPARCECLTGISQLH